MTTIDPRHYRATTECVAAAIAQSISHTEIVTISPYDHEVLAELQAESEGSVEADHAHETWGMDLDANEWRVHVVRESDQDAVDFDGLEPDANEWRQD